MSDAAKESSPQADVSAQRIARVYAEALLNAAEKQDQAEAILEEVDSLISDVYQQEPRLEVLLSSAALGRQERAEIIHKVFQDRASPLFLNFLLVLNDHERLELVRAILVALRDLHDQRAHRIRVQVHSAVPLPDEQKDRLVQIIRSVLGLEPILEAGVDGELIGGMRLRVGDWLYDASLRTELEKIRHLILQRSSHEIQSRRDRFCTTT